MKRYTVTAALPYANGPLHIGHIAGAYLPADTFVRYLRLRNRDVVFICGSDEHGAAITLRARKEGVQPRDIIDKYNALMRDAFRDFGISFDIYHRTSEPIHHATSQNIFHRLYDEHEFVEKTSEQYFDPEAGQFLADRYITGTCPRCGHDRAYGDQCENCGSTLNPTDLINPRSTISGAVPVLKETTHWYLPLDKYQPWLEEWMATKEGKWKTNVFGQCNSWLKGGLQPRAMTRDLDWGVDVPQDIKGAEGKKLYVWLDAPIGYISATKQLFQERATGNIAFSYPDASPNAPKGDANDWEIYWLKQENTEDEARLIHFVGKDNIVFHCIIFPAILHADGRYIVPENVPANEFLNLEGDKISTSRNWAVWLHEYIADFPEHKDTLRYVLASIAPETKDSEFTWKDFQQRHNSELNAIFSNFVHRVLVLTHKYCGGNVPSKPTDAQASPNGEDFRMSLASIEAALENYRFREALIAFMDIARAGNKYLTEREPWKRVKESQTHAEETLFECLQLIAKMTVLCRIFLPETANKLEKMLQMPEEARNWESLANDILLPVGHTIGEAVPLFMNIDDTLIEAQIAKLQATKVANMTENAASAAVSVPSAPENLRIAPKPLKPEITFEDFSKMDIRVGTITAAQRVPKADKLLQFTVDMGFETRTIVSGVAEHFAPESLIGAQVQVLANLAPRKIRGVESQGMILYAENLEGKLIRVSPTPTVDNGSTVN